MKVLFVTNMYPVKDFIYFGIHVKEQIEAIKSNNGIDNEVYFINGRENKLNYFKSIWNIRKMVNNNKFDAIHVHYGISGLFLLFFKPKVPVIMTLHSGELFQKKGFINHLLQKKLTLTLLKRVNKIIVLNDEMISLLHLWNNKLIKLPCGTDLNYFNKKIVDAEPNKIIIGFPGNRERKEKNYQLFKKIIDQINATQKISVIEFHNLTREEVVTNLNKIDILVMTSLVEGSPQIIKEAMACNKPIVATAVGDVQDLLKDVTNCFVIKSFEPADFLYSINKILEIPIEERKTNGREKLLKMQLDSKSVSKKVYEIYKELV